MQTEHISFRASAPKVAALARSAREAGAAQPAGSDHEQAEQGDGAAYAHLADLHYRRGLDGYEPTVIAYARAIACARLAAMARGERQDWLNVLFLLDCSASALRAAGQGSLADVALGEAVALAEDMAEAGDEEISHMVPSSADHLSLEALAIARDLRAPRRRGARYAATAR